VRPQIRSRPRLAGALGVLTAAFVFAAPAPARAVEPWEFPDAASRSEASRLSNYWYENYPEATRIIESGNAAKLDEGIARLRVCIANEKASSQRKLHPKDRRNIEYFPYYYLAQAFAMKNEPGMAKRCLDKEAQYGEISTSKLAASFDSLRSSVDALAFAGPLLDHAARAEGWLAGQGGVSLSADGRQSADAVRSAAGQLRTALGSPQNAGPLQNGSDTLMRELLGLCEGELSSLTSRLEQLGREPWRGAFPNSSAIDPGACAMPGGTPSPERIAGAQDAVESCNGQVVRAMRTAGGWACGELETKRTAATTAAGQLRNIGGDPGNTPGLPGSCGVDWAQSDLAALRQAIDTLDLAAAQQQYQEQITRIAGLIAEEQEEALRGVTATLTKVSRPSRGCVSTLSLTTAMRAIDPLPSSPTEALVVEDLDGKVDNAMAALVTDLGSGVQRLRGRSEKGNCSVDFAPVDRGLTAFSRDRRSADLNALCSAAESANGEIRSCMAGQIELVQAEVEEQRWPLEAALGNSEGWEGAPAEAAAVRDCLAASERLFRTSRPGNDASSWIDRVQTEMENSRGCLLEYQGLRQAALTDVATRVGSLTAPLQALDCENPEASVARFCGLKGEVEQLNGRLAPLSSLWSDENADPRRILADAGLDSEVPSDWLQRYDDAQGDDEQALLVRQAIGDRALGAVLDASGPNLASWERVVGGLRPFLALTDAFAAFERGELNHAIHALRAAQSEGALPPNGKATALSHAALAYFLFVKSKAGSADGVTALLEQDARQEALEAVRADASFGLNETLFANVKFRTFFEDCCGNATR